MPSPNHPPSWFLARRNVETIRSWMPFWGWAHDHYFPVSSDGWENIPHDGPVLFVGSHNGGLAAPDMFMAMYAWFNRFGVERPIYGLMHPKVWQGCPFLASMAEECGAIVAHPKMALQALKQGSSVLVYPGGSRDVFRPYSQRHKICLQNHQGFIKLALRENIPIVPLVSDGAHETLIVLADIYPLMKQLHEHGMPWFLGIDPEVFPIYLGWPWGVAFGPLMNIPWPKPIRLRVGEAIAFERSGREAARDRDYVGQCYTTVEQSMQKLLDSLVAKP